MRYRISPFPERSRQAPRPPAPGQRWLVVLATWTTLWLGGMPTTAEEFSSLQVLPKDIERRQLMEIMNGYSRDLGVRCEHCHENNSQSVLPDINFESNANENKEVARQMMRMTQQINDAFLPKTGRKPVMEVTCGTCHRGQARPLSLEETLTASFRQDGLKAALERYSELRDDWYGRASFDFGEATLRRLARQLSREGKDAAALAFLERNLEHYPDAPLSWMQLAGLQQKAGATADAMASYRRVLELDPDNSRAKRRLRDLEP